MSIGHVVEDQLQQNSYATIPQHSAYGQLAVFLVVFSVKLTGILFITYYFLMHFH